MACSILVLITCIDQCCFDSEWMRPPKSLGLNPFVRGSGFFRRLPSNDLPATSNHKGPISGCTLHTSSVGTSNQHLLLNNETTHSDSSSQSPAKPTKLGRVLRIHHRKRDTSRHAAYDKPALTIILKNILMSGLPATAMHRTHLTDALRPSRRIRWALTPESENEAFQELQKMSSMSDSRELSEEAELISKSLQA